MSADKGLPKIILFFMAVDWPLYMRRPIVFALAEAARAYGSTVVAVNRPLCPVTTVLRKPKRLSELIGPPMLEKLAENLFLFSPRYVLHDQLARNIPGMIRADLRALRRSYEYLQEKIGISEPNPVVWYNYPTQAYLCNLFENAFTVFEIRDALVGMDGSPLSRAIALEEQARPKVDLLVTNSFVMQKTYGPLYRDSVFSPGRLGRAAFGRLTDPSVAPMSELLKIPSPRLGYAGVLSDRIDWPLVEALVEAEPDWQFVLVGPITDERLVAGIRKKPNVHFPGPVPQEQVPSAVKAFDVGLMPYLDRPFFKYSNALKFYEMAAAGVPQVSSPMDEMRRHPEEVVLVVDNKPETWREAINIQLNRDRQVVLQLGKESARGALWEDSCEMLLKRTAGIIAAG